MFHFQSLDVYKCAIKFLPLACELSKTGGQEIGTQLRRASLSINLNIAEGTRRFDQDQRRFLTTARGSALECAAILDAIDAINLGESRIRDGHALLLRIVEMLTKMIR